MAEHTPGPLHVIEPAGDSQCCGIVDEDLQVVAYVGVKGRPNAANARLYAAAPDLLALALEMAEFAEAVQDYLPDVATRQARDLAGRARRIAAGAAG